MKLNCQCGALVDNQTYLQIELIKKLEWLKRDNIDLYKKLFTQCCSVCLTSMSNDMDGEIQAITWHGQSYHIYKNRFTALDTDSIDYKIVAERFNSSVNNEILRIEAHTNPVLKAKYMAFKAHSKNIGTEGEKLLFHGSRNDNYLSILNNGFDIKRCAGGLQGVGIYFATDASYSISGFTDRMSLEDDKGEEIYKVGNILCCYVYPTSDTGKKDGNYCIRNSEQCYPAFIVYYKY